MKYYELTCLISGDLSEENLGTLLEKINSYVREEGGILTETAKSIKRKLTYLVKKRGVAFLAEIDFQLDPGKLKNLEKKLKMEDQILRYSLLLTKESLKMVPKILAKPKREAIKPKKKVELKEIEEKIEEILGK